VDLKPAVFLSGPMSGLPDFNRAAFNAAATDLRSRGLEVWNPADLVAEDVLELRAVVHGRLAFGSPPEWVDWLAANLAALPRYRVVQTLPGWELSRGSLVEVTAARQMGHTVAPYRPTPKPPPMLAGTPSGAVCRSCGEWRFGGNK